MKERSLHLLAVSFMLLTLPVLSQKVKLAKVALGMSEAEVKTALSGSAPFYIERSSAFSNLDYLVAEADEESFAFTFVDGRVAAFSLMHILPAGQQPFLAPGEQATVGVLRKLITKQTWTPAQINHGETLWLSDANGAPLLDAPQCAPRSGEAWLPFGSVPGTTAGEAPAKSTARLMKPALVSYPPGCGVSIRLNESPSASEDDVVSLVEIQVLDIKAMNLFLAKRRHE